MPSSIGAHPGLSRATTINSLDLAGHDANDTPATAPRTVDPGTLAALEQRLERLRQQPVKANSVQHHLIRYLNHYTRHRTMIHRDWIHDTAFGLARRSELKSVSGGGPVSAQYGITLATTYASNNAHTLRMMRLNHPIEAGYLRAYGEEYLEQQCHKLYEAKGGNADDPVVFVHRRGAVPRLLKAVVSDHEAHKVKTQEVAAGVFAVLLPSAEYVESAEDWLCSTGSRPSPSRIMAATADENPAPPSGPIDNMGLFQRLLGKDSNDIRTRLRDLPKDHGHAAVSRTAAALLEQFLQVGKTRLRPEHQHDRLLHKGLSGLNIFSEQMTTQHSDSMAFSNAFQVFCEELQVALVAAGFYDLRDFRTAASAMLQSKKLPPSVPTPAMFLASSGLGALHEALHTAEKMTGYNTVNLLCTPEGDKTPVYYELSDELRTSQSSPVIYATLNQSQPGRRGVHKPGWGVDDVISALQHHMDKHKDSPVTQVLILDCTLEKSAGEVSLLIDHFADDIVQGRLKMLPCKSYQKFANLGTAKVVAGGVGLVSCRDTMGQDANKALSAAEADLDGMGNLDSQLLVHMLNCREQEFDLLERAASNAAFVDEAFFHGNHQHAQSLGHDEGLPFVSVATESHRLKQVFALHLGETSQDNSASPRGARHQLSELFVPQRSSFGFTHTSFGFMGQVDKLRDEVRISIGQETQAELTEMFYQPSRLMDAEKGSRLTCPQALQDMKQLVRDALRRHPMPRGAKKPALNEVLIHIARKEQETRQAPADQSLDQLRHQSGRDSQRPFAESFTLNKLASIMIHLIDQAERQFDLLLEPAGGPDREPLEDMLDALIYSGMPGVSAPARNIIADYRSQLHLNDLHFGDDEDLQDTCQEWLTDLERLPGMATALTSPAQMPEGVFERLDLQDQDRIIRLMTSSLDNDSILSIIRDALREQQQLPMMERLIETLEQRMDRRQSTPRQQQQRADMNLLRQRLQGFLNPAGKDATSQ
ncbi:hypothetical protein ACKC9G_09460 [Pokkaliibacter sp. CJK22405]|uniref:hypothetical protein n=1 Tax=Pokkaliibacter sp. CJK22405 TaxID=3384615 RepID=UPI0039846C13